VETWDATKLATTTTTDSRRHLTQSQSHSFLPGETFNPPQASVVDARVFLGEGIDSNRIESNRIESIGGLVLFDIGNKWWIPLRQRHPTTKQATDSCTLSGTLPRGCGLSSSHKTAWCVCFFLNRWCWQDPGSGCGCCRCEQTHSARWFVGECNAMPVICIAHWIGKRHTRCRQKTRQDSSSTSRRDYTNTDLSSSFFFGSTTCRLSKIIVGTCLRTRYSIHPYIILPWFACVILQKDLWNRMEIFDDTKQIVRNGRRIEHRAPLIRVGYTRRHSTHAQVTDTHPHIAFV